MNTLYAVVLFAACVYTANAQCDTLKRLLIKKEWADIFSAGSDREKFGTMLWREFFKGNPGAVSLFDRVNGGDIMSAKFTAHAQRVLSGLDMCVALLDDEATLTAQLAHLKSQHDGRGIAAEFYAGLSDALLYVLPDYMGVNRHDASSWKDCLGVIVSGISG